MYIGSSFYSGQTLQCNGISKIVYPPLLKNVEVYNNIVENSGWDGIQVSSAINANIHHNKIVHDSQAKIDWQMTGITLGGGTTGSIYNNLIKDGEGTGIFSNGLGEINIYNNIILNPGKDNNQSSGSYGMYITDQYSFPSMYFNVFNNLILNPKHRGIRFSSENSSNKNQICNNIIIKNEISLNAGQDNHFLEIVGKEVIQKTNYFTANIAQVYFNNSDADDFSLLERSPLIDGGSKLSIIVLISILKISIREQGNGIDIGPYESPFSKSINILNSDAVKDRVFPNPVEKANYFTVIFNNELNGNIIIDLVDERGRKIKELTKYFALTGNQMITLDAIDLKPGINYLQISKSKNKSIIKVMVADEL